MKDNNKKEKVENSNKEKKEENVKVEKKENTKKENDEAEIKEEIPVKVKLRFIEKYKNSITKIENYSSMASQGIKVAIKYIAILAFVLAIISTAGMLYNAKKTVDKTATFIEENIPNFTYENDKIKTNAEQPIYLESDEDVGLGKIIINVSDGISEDQINEYKNEITQYGYGVLVLNNELFAKTSSSDELIEQKYSDFLSQNQITELNKQTLINYMTTDQMKNTYLSLALVMVIYTTFIMILDILCYGFVITVVGYVASLIAKIKLKFKDVFTMSLYALTLSVTLQAIYMLVNIFTTFQMQYFQIMYVGVASIYMVAAIFMLKDDIQKKEEVISKIKEIQKETKKEIEKNSDSQEKKDKPKGKKGKNKDKKNKDDNDELKPEGSNAIVENERIEDEKG